MVSIKEVAKIAGVSTATVSRCLNTPDQVKQLTRDKVNEAIHRTGYSPNTLARNFRRGKTGIIFVIIPDIGSPFFRGIMRGIDHVAEEKNFSILMRETQFNTLTFSDFTNIVLSKQADGIILLASIDPFSFAESPNKSGKHPPIVIGLESIQPELQNFPSVRIDNVAAAKEATNYLVSLGHKKIGFIYGLHTTMLTADRELGYQQAMEEAGLPVKKGWIVEGQLSIPGTIKATRKLLNHQHPPTAIFCATDDMAMACIHEIKSSGLRVPDDISVVGFDDIPYAEIFDPPITTISQPAEEIGEKTMYRMCKVIDGEDISLEPEIIPHKLIIRRSTAKLNHTR